MYYRRKVRTEKEQKKGKVKIEFVTFFSAYLTCATQEEMEKKYYKWNNLKY